MLIERPAALRQEARSELLFWGLLALGSLGIAGLFALLLAASRVPGVENALPIMVGFFRKGLVIHVVFSFVVWLLASFALLTSVATEEMLGGQRPNLARFGAVGQALVMIAFPLLFGPAFIPGSTGYLNNYVPAIDHPSYLLGLVALYAGVALPALRLLASLRLRRAPLGTLPFAMACGAVIYLAALACFAVSAWREWDVEHDYQFFEALFWSGGHVLQFLNTLMLLAGWLVLGRLATGRDLVTPGLFRTSAIILTALAVLELTILVAFRDHAKVAMMFTTLQSGLGPPVLLVGVGAIAALAAYRAEQPGNRMPSPAMLALLLSMLVFTTGGLLGFFVDGTDTRTPAHYHGMIAGVNLMLMGIYLCVLPGLIGRAAARGRRMLPTQLLLFGIGQFIACVGLFWAGGYGTPRKMAGEAQGLVHGAMIGMYLNGIGALIAVIGGVIFVWTAWRLIASHRVERKLELV